MSFYLFFFTSSQIQCPHYYCLSHKNIDSQTITAMSKLCWHCYERKSCVKCSACLVARYCSKECQKSNWKQKGHKLECPKWKAMNELPYTLILEDASHVDAALIDTARDYIARLLSSPITSTTSLEKRRQADEEKYTLLSEITQRRGPRSPLDAGLETATLSFGYVYFSLSPLCDECLLLSFSSFSLTHLLTHSLTSLSYSIFYSLSLSSPPTLLRTHSYALNHSHSSAMPHVATTGLSN